MIIKRRRLRKPTIRGPLSGLAEMGGSPPDHSSLATVTREGESHWEVTEEGHVLVHVVLVPSGTPVSTKLGSLGGGSGHGIWAVPPVGALVHVCIPGGDVTGDCVLTNVLEPPPDGLDEATLIIARENVTIHATGGNVNVIASGNVLVHSGTAGEAVALALKADVDELRTKFNAHVHVTSCGSGAGTAAAPVGVAVPMTGTSVLRAK